jgi:hypothetical protein
MNHFEIIEITLEQFEKNIDDFFSDPIRIADAQFRYALHDEDISLALNILEDNPISSEEKIGIALEHLGYYVGIKKTCGYHDHEYIVKITPEDIDYGDYSGKIYFSKIESGWAIDGWLISSTPSSISKIDKTFCFSIETIELKTFDMLPIIHSTLIMDVEKYLTIAINRGIRDICR